MSADPLDDRVRVITIVTMIRLFVTFQTEMPKENVLSRQEKASRARHIFPEFETVLNGVTSNPLHLLGMTSLYINSDLPSFFLYIGELLERYRFYDRIPAGGLYLDAIRILGALERIRTSFIT